MKAVRQILPRHVTSNNECQPHGGATGKVRSIHPPGRQSVYVTLGVNTSAR